MLVQFTDAKSKDSIAINPTHVVAVFSIPSTPDAEGNVNPDAGKTVIGVVNGNVLVDESYIHVVGVLQAS